MGLERVIGKNLVVPDACTYNCSGGLCFRERPE